MTLHWHPPTTAALPHWEETPADLGAAIREIKAALRARIEASGRTVDEVFAVIEDRIRAKVTEITTAKERGETVWPVIDYADIENGTVTAEELAKLRSRGCLVVRGHFPREQALAWDQDIVDYVESNQFFENYRGPGDDFFGSVGSKPEIYPSTGRRRRCRPGRATGWPASSPSSTPSGPANPTGCSGSTPNRDSLYPDRIRRRPEGANSAGLGTHLDPGTLDLWMTTAYQNAFRHLFDGTVEQYDPWDAAYRTAGPQYPGIDHVLGVPHLPGLDRAVRHGPRPGRAAHRADPRGHGLPHAPAAARRRRRRRHVRRHRQPGLPREREMAPAADRGPQRHPRRQGRRLRLVARRHDPQRRPRRRTRRAGATSCTSRPRPGARGTRSTPPPSAKPSAPGPAPATSPTSTTNASGPTDSRKPT